MSEFTSSLSRQMSEAQRKHAEDTPVVFRLYTEEKPRNHRLVARYFPGATIYSAQGLWQGDLESTDVIEIIGTIADLQTVVNLAGDIKYVNNQTFVLVTWQTLSGRLDV
jgi:hypothetical protein